ncbi:hypothetical protein K443DRAFT_6058 [Laccaria amethystina LaAM-08-1]|uniref:Uncharacterized protein n=1 Tax=Laccaria amethystina LaAM-08-1 TaxID=1095629 RepID=A0A0C9WTX1_9AGAR|nr:hypothetical protein K443DRAFT_6058 [Laccaria amethystina LaAM-08-1]
MPILNRLLLDIRPLVPAELYTMVSQVASVLFQLNDIDMKCSTLLGSVGIGTFLLCLAIQVLRQDLNALGLSADNNAVRKLKAQRLLEFKAETEKGITESIAELRTQLSIALAAYEWELECDAMIRAATPETLSDVTRIRSQITAIREVQLAANILGTWISRSEFLQDAEDVLCEAAGLSTSLTLEDLTADPDLIEQRINTKLPHLDVLQPRLAALKLIPKADLNALQQQLDQRRPPTTVYDLTWQYHHPRSKLHHY